MTHRRLLIASLLGSFTLACASSTHSSDPGSHPDAHGEGGGTGGTTGQGGGGNGGGGDAGSGGTHGTGGSAGAGGVTASVGAGGSTSLDPTAVCRAAIQAQAEGRRINLERAARVGDELGGHIVSGHVDGIGEVEPRAELDLGAPDARPTAPGW